MKKFLVLTDFSEISMMANHYAIQLASIIHAEVHFMHIIMTAVDWFTLSRSNNLSSPNIRQSIETAEQKLMELTQQANKLGISSRFNIAYNRPNFDFTNHINSSDYFDLTITGSHGASGLKELFIGSNAQKIIRYSLNPVLVIKEMPKRIIPDNMVFISLFKRCDLKAFTKLMSIANTFGARVKLLYIQTPFQRENKRDVEKRIMSFLNKLSIKNLDYHIEFGKWSEEGVKDYINKNSPSLVAISTEGRKGLARFRKPSFAENLVNHISIPIISILKQEAF